MSKGNTFENDLLKLIFLGTAIADLAENDTSSPLTVLYISLHTGDPGEGGSQTTSECDYTDYDRVAVDRDADGWTVTDNSAVNAADIDFPPCTGGDDLVTFFAIGTADFPSAGKVLYSGAITSPPGGLAVSDGITPSFAAGELEVTED